MDPSSHPCSLTFELKIIKARNVYPEILYRVRDLFIRCYLPIGNGKRARLESQTIPSESKSLTWDQTFSLYCLGTQDSIKHLEQTPIVFELRYRTRELSCMGRIRKGSKLVGQAEMLWKDMFKPRNMEIDKWVVMIPERKFAYGDKKPPAVQIAIEVKKHEKMVDRKERIDERRLNKCGCNSCMAYEFFAIEAALEALL